MRLAFIEVERRIAVLNARQGARCVQRTHALIMAVDEAALTGGSVPMSKGAGDGVRHGTHLARHLQPSSRPTVR